MTDSQQPSGQPDSNPIPKRGTGTALFLTAATLVGAMVALGQEGEWTPDSFDQRLIPSPIQAGGKPGDAAKLSSGKPSVFELPLRYSQVTQLQQAMRAFSKSGQLDKAKAAAAAASKLLPDDPISQYNLACMAALEGDKDAAFAALQKCADLNFSRVEILKNDTDMNFLRDDKRFTEIMTAVTKNAESKSTADADAADVKKPGTIKKGVGMVAEENTQWAARRQALYVQFDVDEDELKKKPVTENHGKIGDKLNEWYRDGTATGLAGVYYDNHDRDHSNLKYKNFPQLTRIEYSKEAKKVNLDRGLQSLIFFDGVTMGNSSMAVTGRPMWRSMPRIFMADPKVALRVHNQYVGNHIYLYPEHTDYDAGEKVPRFGDVYPTNTPYVITSFGSSFSDKPFMDAVICTIAAFHPDVRAALEKRGLLMPMVQMIFRRCQKHVQSDADYLTGDAHPVVFNSDRLDADRMVEMAHSMTKENLPPFAVLKVLREDRFVPGRDYFHIGTEKSEELMTTPAVIARVFRTVHAQRRMVIDASKSVDLNGKPLKFYWKLLHGNPKRVTIKPGGKDDSQAEILVRYHPRRPVKEDSPLKSNRIEIGVFVKNDKYFSAPAFVTSFTIANEHREYKNGLVQVVDYVDKTAKRNYVDPLLDFRKDWRDEYHYDKQNRLTGWTRIRGTDREEFSRHGILVTSKDKRGRPKTGVVVNYAREVRGRENFIKQTRTKQKATFRYASATSTIGTPVPVKPASE